MSRLSYFLILLAIYLLCIARVVFADTGVLYDIGPSKTSGSIKVVPSGETVPFKDLYFPTTDIKMGDLVSFEMAEEDAKGFATHLKRIQAGTVINGGVVFITDELKEGDLLTIRGHALIKDDVLNKGGILIVTDGSVIRRNLTALGGSTTIISNGSVVGRIYVNKPGYLTIRDGSAIQGKVIVDQGESVQITNSTVLDNVRIYEANVVSVVSNVIHGYLKIFRTLGACDEADNTVLRLKNSCP